MNKIRGICCDVDGVLTDGGYIYTPYADGSMGIGKKFNCRDAAASLVWRNTGHKLFIVTAGDDDVTRARMERYTPYCYYGVADKGQMLKTATVLEISETFDIPVSQMAFIGDDHLDIPAMVVKDLGLKACPADAAARVMRLADYVCMRPGGNGALAELIEHLLYLQDG